MLLIVAVYSLALVVFLACISAVTLKLFICTDLRNLRCDQVYLKGRAKRHPDVADGRSKKSKAVADFLMEGNRNVTYGKFEHVVSLLLMCRHDASLVPPRAF